AKPGCPAVAIVLQPAPHPGTRRTLSPRSARTPQPMKNFLRALRYCWPYRYRQAVSVACALLADALSGLHFPATHPVPQIFGGDQNLQAWAEERVVETQRRIDGDPEKGGEGLQPKLEGLLKQEKEVDGWPDSPLKEKQKTELARLISRAQSQLE